MNSRTSASSDTFPSLSSGIGADGNGLRQFESSLDRIVSGGRSQERAEPDTHVVAYNSRFQFFHTKRTSTINDSSVNDLATREDSLVKAWRTVSEIDALLGSDFRPSMPTCEEERPSPVDEAYVKRLNSELEAAMNLSLTFKERYRAGRIGNRNDGGGGGGGGWLGFVGVGGSAAPPGQRHAEAGAAVAAGDETAARETQAGTVGGPDVGLGALHAVAPSLHFPNSSPRQRHLEASEIVIPHSPFYCQQIHYQHQCQRQPQPHALAPCSPRMSPRMTASGGGGVVVAPPPPSSSQADVTVLTYASTSAPLLNGDRVGGPATAAFAGTVLGPTRGNECLPSYSSVHIPVPRASPGPPPSPRSVQMCTASTSTSMGSAAAAPLLPPSASAPPPAVAPLAAALPQSLRRLHGGGIRVAVGSALDHGVWDSDGVWRSADPVHEVYIPQNLQRISPDDLVKVRELGRGCFGSVWLAKWRGVEVALKELLNQASLDGPPNEVFYEAERLASLRHPCVIAFYGIVAAPGCYATVVEYMKMGSLKSGLSRLRKQAARGMEYLHSQYLVHFDLKWGRFNAAQCNHCVALKRCFFFDLWNFHPSLPSPPARSFPQVDVFSFGIVLWEIWQLGEQPYSSYSLADIFAGVMTGSLRPGLPSDCDPDWAALMKACWHDNPLARPSFGKVAERLEDILERVTKQEIAAAVDNGGDQPCR
ncbi:hypothetical protein Vretimale_17815 [Volvox reticuliferus]|uniref:Protein kinase domain-containing protein n=1 Tax=Volvox reticuliferus TaxID=1737510 RepID=A0A8J4CYR9_9CHLO|nr:hypothetical protein Vretifemale_19047 [Volvox reticuliferus]GIM14966.1 hypothetical protein Vretimale_17815 [Volvox reticuliferus]